VLDEAYDRTHDLSQPVHQTGWSEPIGSLGGFGYSLRNWADQLEGLGPLPPPD
jgi:hypothetical protein